AGRYRAVFFHLYRGLRLWQRAMADRLRQQGAIETRSVLGRRRLDVSKFNDATNAPIHGTGADGFKHALALLFEHRHEVPTAKPILAVHDELAAECPLEDVAATEEWLKRHMEAGMAEAVAGKVPIQVETTIGRDWAGTPVKKQPKKTGTGTTRSPGNTKARRERN